MGQLKTELQSNSQRWSELEIEKELKQFCDLI